MHSQDSKCDIKKKSLVTYAVLNLQLLFSNQINLRTLHLKILSFICVFEDDMKAYLLSLNRLLHLAIAKAKDPTFY